LNDTPPLHYCKNAKNPLYTVEITLSFLYKTNTRADEEKINVFKLHSKELNNGSFPSSWYI